MSNSSTYNTIRQPVEIRFQKELQILLEEDKTRAKPDNWKLSPKAVLKFISGGEVQDSPIPITKKFYGDEIQISRIVASLASDRAVLLIGEPGTAKSYLSEFLAAAISGISTNTIQGSAGTTEDSIKYSWNYALLLAKGPSEESLVPAPIYLGMKHGWITRFEEITRSAPEIQDIIIPILSDKMLVIPELPSPSNLLIAKKGFNLIGTANTRDRGVNEMSAALKRRFNFEHISPLKDIEEEIKLVKEQVDNYLESNSIKQEFPTDTIELLVTTFSELRNGETYDEGVKLDRPSITMSTAECVDIASISSTYMHYFNEDPEKSAIIALKGILKDNVEDLKKIQLYFDIVVKKRSSKAWKRFYELRNYLD